MAAKRERRKKRKTTKEREGKRGGRRSVSPLRFGYREESRREKERKLFSFVWFLERKVK